MFVCMVSYHDFMYSTCTTTYRRRIKNCIATRAWCTCPPGRMRHRLWRWPQWARVTAHCSCSATSADWEGCCQQRVAWAFLQAAQSCDICKGMLLWLHCFDLMVNTHAEGSAGSGICKDLWHSAEAHHTTLIFPVVIPKVIIINEPLDADKEPAEGDAARDRCRLLRVSVLARKIPPLGLRLCGWPAIHAHRRRRAGRVFAVWRGRGCQPCQVRLRLGCTLEASACIAHTA